jgi:hypothetical protein
MVGLGVNGESQDQGGPKIFFSPAQMARAQFQNALSICTDGLASSPDPALRTLHTYIYCKGSIYWS